MNGSAFKSKLQSIMQVLSFQFFAVQLLFAQSFDKGVLQLEKTATHILFAARSPTLIPLSPGHAFASFMVQDSQQNCIVDAYGFYPCDHCNILLDEGIGRIVSGFDTNSRKRALLTLSFPVDTQYNTATEAVLKQWENVEYNLISHNCVKFISDVATAQGLDVPKTTYLGFLPKLPKAFIRQLRRKNKSLHAMERYLDEKGIPDCPTVQQEQILASLTLPIRDQVLRPMDSKSNSEK